jgi:hypothetical protein
MVIKPHAIRLLGSKICVYALGLDFRVNINMYFVTDVVLLGSLPIYILSQRNRHHSRVTLRVLSGARPTARGGK